MSSAVMTCSPRVPIRQRVRPGPRPSPGSGPLTGLGELTARNGDARGMLLMGKSALNRGLPFDHYAYPVNGIPSFRQVGPEVEQSVVYAIARQESAFNPAVVSPAQAYGLMQVTPDAGRYVCKRAGIGFAAGTIEGASAAIAAAHETEGHDNPTADPTVRAVRRGGAGQRDHEAGVVLELTVGVVDGTAQGPYPRILDTGCDYAAVGSVAVLPVS
mgnify:CR=1 FL=1